MNIYKLTILLVALVIFFEVSFAFAQEPVNPFQFGIKKKEAGQKLGGWQFLPDITQCGEVTRDSNGKIIGRKSDFGTCLLWFFNKLLSVIYTLALFLGVIYLVYAGIEYITKPGNAQQIHQRLIWGITGIVVAIIAFSLVKAIEISLSTDEAVITGTPPPITTPEGGQPPTEEPPIVQPPIAKPKIVVSNASFIPEGNFYSIIFTEKLDTNDPSVSCRIDLRIFNLSRGTTKQYQFTSDNFTTLHGRKDAGGIAIDLPSGSKAGDKIQLQFLQNKDCQVPAPISLTVPREAVQPAQPAIRPIIFIEKPAILGQQKFTIEIPENLGDVVVQVFDVYFRQSRLYDPPFYLYIRYSAPNNQISKTCTFVVNAAGIRVTSYSGNKAVSLKSFNQLFRLNLKLERGAQDYTKMLPIGLSNNIIEKVKLRAVELQGCDYRVAGGNVGNWAYETKITAQ